MITIPFEDLRNMITDAVEVGFMKAVRTYDPDTDSIRATQVKSWLKRNNVEPKLFQSLIDDGSIVGRRKGTAKNSPIYYSKEEIRQAVMSVKQASVLFNL